MVSSSRSLDRLFAGVYPCGIVYADRKREKAGDYLRLAFLSYTTLKLEWEPNASMPADLRDEIERDAGLIQARKGELFQISSSGQTVRLGGNYD